MYSNIVTSLFSEDCPRSVRHFPEIPNFRKFRILTLPQFRGKNKRGADITGFLDENFFFLYIFVVSSTFLVIPSHSKVQDTQARRARVNVCRSLKCVLSTSHCVQLCTLAFVWLLINKFYLLDNRNTRYWL